MNVCGGFGDADVRISWLGHLGRWWGGGGGGGRGSRTPIRHKSAHLILNWYRRQRFFRALVDVEILKQPALRFFGWLHDLEFSDC